MNFTGWNPTSRLTVGVDNNYPFSVGRHVGTGAPDDDEIVTLRLPRKVG